MDVAADESQTHSQFITESMASNRDELRVAALKELQQRALDKWVAQNGTSAGVQNYKLYKSISQELAETEQGLDGGYLYPMLRGPARGKHLVLEDLPNAGGFRVDPNMDTISAVFPSLLQLRNLTVAPPRIIKASPVLDSKIYKVLEPHPLARILPSLEPDRLFSGQILALFAIFNFL
ncbi:hypothetical protein Ndes2526B_g00837 [Nannochloris sp. 'desiccata']